MRGLMTLLEPGTVFKHGLVSGTLHNSESGRRVAVLGRYDEGDKFPGTDKLSMAASPAVIEWLDSPGRADVVLFEGDRLFTGKFLDACAARFEPCHFYILTAETDRLMVRHALRSDAQTPTFIKGRVTKYKNLASYPNVQHFEHRNSFDTYDLMQRIGRVL